MEFKDLTIKTFDTWKKFINKTGTSWVQKENHKPRS